MEEKNEKVKIHIMNPRQWKREVHGLHKCDMYELMQGYADYVVHTISNSVISAQRTADERSVATSAQ